MSGFTPNRKSENATFIFNKTPCGSAAAVVTAEAGTGDANRGSENSANTANYATQHCTRQWESNAKTQ